MKSNKYEYVPDKVDYTLPPPKSPTVPDMAVSVAEIMHRFTVGMEPGVPELPEIYAGTDEDLERLARMSFDDKAQYAQDLRNEREAAIEHIKAQRAEKELERAARNQAIRDQAEILLAARKAEKAEKGDGKTEPGSVTP